MVKIRLINTFVATKEQFLQKDRLIDPREDRRHFDRDWYWAVGMHHPCPQIEIPPTLPPRSACHLPAPPPPPPPFSSRFSSQNLQASRHFNDRSTDAGHELDEVLFVDLSIHMEALKARVSGRSSDYEMTAVRYPAGAHGFQPRMASCAVLSTI